MPEMGEVLIIFMIKKTLSGLGGGKESQRNLVEDLKRYFKGLH